MATGLGPHTQYYNAMASPPATASATVAANARTTSPTATGTRTYTPPPQQQQQQPARNPALPSDYDASLAGTGTGTAAAQENPGSPEGEPAFKKTTSFSASFNGIAAHNQEASTHLGDVATPLPAMNRAQNTAAPTRPASREYVATAGLMRESIAMNALAIHAQMYTPAPTMTMCAVICKATLSLTLILMCVRACVRACACLHGPG